MHQRRRAYSNGSTRGAFHANNNNHEEEEYDNDYEKDNAPILRLEERRTQHNRFLSPPILPQPPIRSTNNNSAWPPSPPPPRHSSSPDKTPRISHTSSTRRRGAVEVPVSLLPPSTNNNNNNVPLSLSSSYGSTEANNAALQHQQEEIRRFASLAKQPQHQKQLADPPTILDAYHPSSNHNENNDDDYYYYGKNNKNHNDSSDVLSFSQTLTFVDSSSADGGGNDGGDDGTGGGSMSSISGSGGGGGDKKKEEEATPPEEETAAKNHLVEGWDHHHHHPLENWLFGRDAEPETSTQRQQQQPHSWLLSSSYTATLVVARLARHHFYNPQSPEFTSLQQFNWAIVLGIFMGLFTAVWKAAIEHGVGFIWETIPTMLVQQWPTVFAPSTGSFPIYHYTWITPALLGAILSASFVHIQGCPDQNDWIHNLHTRGIQDHRTFFPLLILSTVGMWSGMSLGPELPLVLLGGMVGSWLALVTRQSILQARVMNLTAASAAVSGFFGFPMAGALFVLELPHRMGLQYFEALSPATISSIVAVLANRLVTGNDVTGYFRYPWLDATLPSSIFTYAIVYGIYGCCVGTLYVYLAKICKSLVHSGFHDVVATSMDKVRIPHPSDDRRISLHNTEESTPLVPSKSTNDDVRMPSLWNRAHFMMHKCLEQKSIRAALTGAVAGGLCGAIGIFLPHTLFWGESQLQNLIDKGRTPLPVFGAMSDLAVHARCMIDPAVHAGFSIQCSAVIAVAKTIAVGLSLGTGIIGGQFWGPLFVGCAASHLFTDMVDLFHAHFGFGRGLASYPCVVILCTMAAAHVVTFRAHIAIMLILTLTISAFNPESLESNSPATVAGDYSAVFPLLVVAVFVSLMASRDTVVYIKQRSRGDITAVPEVLCRPGMEGAPYVVDYDGEQCDDNAEYSDIEYALASGDNTKTILQKDSSAQVSSYLYIPTASTSFDNDAGLSSSRLDELLGLSVHDENKPGLDSNDPWRAQISSEIIKGRSKQGRPGSNDTPTGSGSNRERSNSAGSQQGLVRVNSFGEVSDHQPSLMDQARLRSASSASETKHRRVPSLPTALPGLPKHQHFRASSLTTPRNT